jgi:hypothetical protein
MQTSSGMVQMLMSRLQHTCPDGQVTCPHDPPPSPPPVPLAPAAPSPTLPLPVSSPPHAAAAKRTRANARSIGRASIAKQLPDRSAPVNLDRRPSPSRDRVPRLPLRWLTCRRPSPSPAQLGASWRNRPSEKTWGSGRTHLNLPLSFLVDSARRSPGPGGARPPTPAPPDLRGQKTRRRPRARAARTARTGSGRTGERGILASCVHSAGSGKQANVGPRFDVRQWRKTRASHGTISLRQSGRRLSISGSVHRPEGAR